MLKNSELIAVLPAKDLGRAREYYRDKLGLEVAEETPGGLVYRMASGAAFLLYETSNAGTARNTQMCWTTADIEAEMAELRGRGVVFEEYDLPGLKTENGVATMDGERGSWFIDSEGNTLCLTQQT
ncbi:VOC family protein [Cryobacterium sp. Sr8]|uniref:Uncharacterized protein n=1 Tax=Cryobacterium psychrotolerans TaxID=386301 RepID=A0A1G9CDQ1_9MICO|nr:MULTISPECIES: VOC family protein [Cryobacterium]TFD43372.1 VOC family protein [Cryobacterium sp. TMT1-2-1]TFD74129.1 VOC family protein [Cryobacterium sp. Sr8]TFD84320.1 VOC family protein [Cryobacterium psychrotolerans]SDK49555.1 hypothetical protein SAMN05216282_10715 [Cryobacterium psychrotolerans]